MSEPATNIDTKNISQLPAVAVRKPQEVRVVSDPIAVLDTARFEHMQRIAKVMACSNLIPESLCMVGKKDEKENLPLETVIANCFLVVNQAVRWNMDPFAVAQCVSVVHGKLCYEGKLIAAVLEAKLGIDLDYEWDSKPGEKRGIKVSGTLPNGKTKSISGTVEDWKTTGAGSAWGASKNWQRMLAYRGAREWSRLYAPGLMLGVLSDDEIEVLASDRRARTARDVTPHDDGPPSPAELTEIEHKSAVETVESGRDNGQTVVWEDSATTPQERDDETAWLNELDGAFSSCTDMSSLFEKQKAVMSPMKGSVSTETWAKAKSLAESHFNRVQREE